MCLQPLGDSAAASPTMTKSCKSHSLLSCLCNTNRSLIVKCAPAASFQSSFDRKSSEFMVMSKVLFASCEVQVVSKEKGALIP